MDEVLNEYFSFGLILPFMGFTFGGTDPFMDEVLNEYFSFGLIVPFMNCWLGF